MANFAANNNTENAAREAWQSFLKAHPRFQGILSIVSSFFGYFLNGHAIVALVQWLVRVAGRIAESALLLATLYVTLNNVAHTLITWILPANAIDLLNYLSVVAFSLLPELIVAAAIKVTVDHWSMLFRDKTWRNPAWVWATLYSIPTITFVVMTITTLSSFVQIEASSGSPMQATGTALTVRFLAGWGYAMTEILFATIGKKSYVATFGRLQAMVATQGQELSALKTTEQGLRATFATATTERDSQRQRADTMATDLQSAMATIATLQRENGAIATERDGLRAEAIGLQEELKAIKARIARRENSRAVAMATPTALATTEQDSPQSMATHSPKDTGYIARDDGATMAIANSHGDTIIATGSHRDRIKEVMAWAMQNDENLTYQAIADAAGAGYSTVKKYAKELQEEIAREATGKMPVIVTPDHQK